MSSRSSETSTVIPASAWLVGRIPPNCRIARGAYRLDWRERSPSRAGALVGYFEHAPDASHAKRVGLSAVAHAVGGTVLVSLSGRPDDDGGRIVEADARSLGEWSTRTERLPAGAREPRLREELQRSARALDVSERLRTLLREAAGLGILSPDAAAALVRCWDAEVAAGEEIGFH